MLETKPGALHTPGKVSALHVHPQPLWVSSHFTASHTHTLPGTRVLFQQLKATSKVLQRASGGIKKTKVKFLRFLPICLRILNTYILSIKRIVVCPDTFVILFLEVQAFPSGYQWVFGKSIHQCSNITWHYLQRLNRTGKKHGHWPGEFG